MSNLKLQSVLAELMELQMQFLKRDKILFLPDLSFTLCVLED